MTTEQTGFYRSQATWYQTVAGEYVQQQEQSLYDQSVFDLFGFNALQMGRVSQDLLANSRIPNRYAASAYASEMSDLHCEDDFLPFAEMSLDLLLLPHRLEFSERPHQTLREAARVLVPEGHLIISGFNPISFWGLRFLTAKMINQLLVLVKKRVENSFDDYPWHGHLIRLARLKDWLALLGFEVVSVEKACHVPPFASPKLHHRFAWLDNACKKSLRTLGCNQFGGVYFVVAKKRVPGVRPMKPFWKKSHIPSVLLPQPTRHNSNKNGHRKSTVKHEGE